MRNVLLFVAALVIAGTPAAAYAGCPGGFCRVVSAPVRAAKPALRAAAAPVRFVAAGVERRQERRQARRDARRGS